MKHYQKPRLREFRLLLQRKLVEGKILTILILRSMFDNVTATNAPPWTNKSNQFFDVYLIDQIPP